jgi:arginine N-succinyltransferase
VLLPEVRVVVLRPITLDDLDAVEALTALTGYGLTTLPRDAKLLRRRIRESVRGFEHLVDEDPPKGETYLFVLEDVDEKKVVGTCGVVSKVGGFEPFYAYRMETEVFESKQLNVRKEVCTLHLVEEHDGPCEIGSLFLSPDYRKDGNGRLLSLSRFLFMADHAEYFDPMVIAEMRGVVDDEGHSPFWEAVGRHFFDIDFPSADYLSMVNKRFIADLMPRLPIYVTLLPKAAQAVVGRVHEQTEPALRILEAEGFRKNDQVDIFEAGPVVRCPLRQIRSIAHSNRAIIDQVTADEPESDMMIISNGRHAFRACKGTVASTATGGVRIGASVAAALQVSQGDAVRYVTARAPAPVEGAANEAPCSI